MARRQYREPITLSRVFHCYLTTDERNEYYEYLSKHEISLHADRLKAEQTKLELQATAGIDVGDAAYQLTLQTSALNDQVYEVAKEWHTNVILPRIEAEESITA